MFFTHYSSVFLFPASPGKEEKKRNASGDQDDRAIDDRLKDVSEIQKTVPVVWIRPSTRTVDGDIAPVEYTVRHDADNNQVDCQGYSAS